MKNDLFYSVKKAVKYWWISPIIGLITIILGFWCIADPLLTLVVIGSLFIAGFLISGVFEIIFAISNRNTLKGWGWTFTSGIIDIAFGLLLLAIPIGTIAILLFLTGFWVMFRSIWLIGSSIELQRNNVKGWGWTLASGILGTILAFILIANPAFATGFIVYLLAFSLFMYGIIRIYHGFKLKNLHKEKE
ncbi:MAG: DUF308 domain-containing protein [Prevotella sp.]|jgi:uncharacterized membrane protein HdeD (DUF308 family)|nr:DUF308 domain-containing protein [Prevotella sp.]